MKEKSALRMFLDKNKCQESKPRPIYNVQISAYGN